MTSELTLEQQNYKIIWKPRKRFSQEKKFSIKLFDTICDLSKTGKERELRIFISLLNREEPFFDLCGFRCFQGTYNDNRPSKQKYKYEPTDAIGYCTFQYSSKKGKLYI